MLRNDRFWERTEDPVLLWTGRLIRDLAVSRRRDGDCRFTGMAWLVAGSGDKQTVNAGLSKARANGVSG